MDYNYMCHTGSAFFSSVLVQVLAAEAVLAAARAGNLFQIFTMLPRNTFLWSLGILSVPSAAPRVLPSGLRLDMILVREEPAGEARAHYAAMAASRATM